MTGGGILEILNALKRFFGYFEELLNTGPPFGEVNLSDNPSLTGIRSFLVPSGTLPLTRSHCRY